ncbi:MAG: hypothetical protein H7Z19_12435 [Chitinophagaceae bacterium]|nr:hypothetical protein [Rubrivivax sp.]
MNKISITAIAAALMSIGGATFAAPADDARMRFQAIATGDRDSFDR